MALLLHPDLWISRRTEAVDFVDEQTVTRRVSVSFEVPPIAHGFEVRPGRKVLFAPLALFGKGLVRHLTVTTGAGEQIPMLNRADSEAVAAAMLVELGTSVVGEPLDDDIRAELEAIATGDPEDAFERVGRFMKLAADPASGQRHLLWQEPRAHVLIHDLARKFIFIVPTLDTAEHDERIVVYSYQETLESKPPGLLVRLGWRSMPLEVKVPSVGLARTCDIDIRVPDDLSIRRARLLDLRTRTSLTEDSECGRTAHLYVPRPERETRGRARMELYVPAGAFSWATFGAAALATVILGAGAIWAEQFARSAESASAMLLGVPALLAGYLTRPGEHGLVQRAVWGLRLALAVTFVVSLLAIVALVSGLDAAGREIWFAVSAGLTGLAAGAVVISLVSARRSEMKSPPIGGRAVEDQAAQPGAPVRFPEALAQHGVELKGLWAGSPEGYLAETPGRISADRTVELLTDMRSRLQSPAPVASQPLQPRSRSAVLGELLAEFRDWLQAPSAPAGTESPAGAESARTFRGRFERE
jgi:hypothetical protein